ncbi:Kv channel-interacting protein 2-like [Thalassophryne amazonica]|uniref:Kv channel-interacting protein 2-like n=1 Tax=Thalassophryne amazonica TaxID=390379 RepID=UPI001470A569|nr:Kv channel-interacting protein 2-like [Thalassophryne amazonica]
MKPRIQDQSISESRELDRSYDPLTGNLPSKPNKKTIKQRFLKLLPCCGAGSNPSLNQRSLNHQGELSTVCCRPDGLDSLIQQTKFSRKELQILYRRFKNECPSGVVTEETFKTIYSQFFPQGDSNMYAHFLFEAFDTQNKIKLFSSFNKNMKSFNQKEIDGGHEAFQDNNFLHHASNEKMGKNKDGVVTIEEFLETCQKDENIMQSMHLFDNVI